jgi:hypothetical protein
VSTGEVSLGVCILSRCLFIADIWRDGGEVRSCGTVPLHCFNLRCNWHWRSNVILGVQLVCLVYVFVAIEYDSKYANCIDLLPGRASVTLRALRYLHSEAPLSPCLHSAVPAVPEESCFPSTPRADDIDLEVLTPPS